MGFRKILKKDENSKDKKLEEYAKKIIDAQKALQWVTILVTLASGMLFLSMVMKLVTLLLR